MASSFSLFLVTNVKKAEKTLAKICKDVAKSARMYTSDVAYKNFGSEDGEELFPVTVQMSDVPGLESSSELEAAISLRLVAEALQKVGAAGFHQIRASSFILWL